MSTVSKTFTAVGASAVLTVPPGQALAYEATESTFVGIATFERSRNGGASWEAIESATDASMTGGNLVNETASDEWFRFRVVQNGGSAVSGSLACAVYDRIAATKGRVRKHTKVYTLAHHAKVGATAGWVPNAAANTALVTCPASQTGSTLVATLPEVDLEDTIVGFYLIGQIESGGNTATLDVEMRKHTAAAADVADASVASMAQVSVTADAKLDSSNTYKGGLSVTPQEGETFYFLVTATTGVSTDIALQGLVVEVLEAY